MEIMRFYKQKRILHKYVRWMYEMLEDGRFYHLQRASNIKDLPKHYVKGEKVRYLERMYHCADNLQGHINYDTGEHTIERGWFCGDRVCPVCQIKKSLWEYSKLTWQMEHFQEEYTYYFLTLTLPNNPDGFRDEINLLSSCLTELGAFLGLARQKRDSVNQLCDGMYGSYEITKSEHGWHPHLHLVLAYPTKFIGDSDIRTYLDPRTHKKRTFVNKLEITNGKKELILSHDAIMHKFIELVKKKTGKYNERLEDLNFLNIGFEPCYNIEQGVNEMTKYLIDFEALETSDDLFTYLFDSYKLTQRVRRGIFRWTPEVKAAHKEFLDKLHKDAIFILYNSTQNVVPCSFTWYGNCFLASSVVIEERPKEFTNQMKKVAVRRSMFLSVTYPKGREPTYRNFRLTDKLLPNWKILDDSNSVIDEFEYSQVMLN